MTRFMFWLSFAALLAALSPAQPAASGPTFEVASVRRGVVKGPADIARSCTGGPNSSDPENFRCPCKAMAAFLLLVYDVGPAGLDGPPWIMDNYICFDIVAKLPPGTDREQFRRMLQNLLVERFHLAIHHESRMLPSSSLVVAKGGPKLKPAAKTAASVDSPASRPTELPWSVSMKDARSFRLTARRMNMKALATFVESALRAPVTDGTGLAGDYEFTLDFLPPGYPAAVPTDPSIADPGDDLDSALQSQLGLKLNTQKLPRDVIVIDHVDQAPAEN